MATFSGLAPVRDDFRCSLCQQKNTFHCEHDTPYRDQLLGTYNQEKPYTIPPNNRRSSQRASLNNNSSNKPTSGDKMRHGNENARHGNENVRHEAGSRPSNIPPSHPNPNPRFTDNRNLDYNVPPNKNEKKKDKSCIIL